MTLDQLIRYRADITASIKSLEDGDPDSGLPSLKETNRLILDNLRDMQAVGNGAEYLTTDDTLTAKIIRQTRKVLDKDLLVQYVGTEVIAKCEKEQVVEYVRVDEVKARCVR